MNSKPLRTEVFTLEDQPRLIQNDRTRMKRKPRLGFVGCGWIGRHRLEALCSMDAVEAVGIVDQSSDAIRNAMEVSPGLRPIEQLEELLDLPLDGVVIATPSALHAEQAVLALEKGMAVFCQKPLARNSRETMRVVETARRVNRLIEVDFSYRHVAGVAEIREAVVEGKIGEVYALDLVFYNAYGPDKSWFYDRRLSGGGCVVDLGIHLIDLALYLTGLSNATDVSSHLFRQGKRLLQESEGVEDFATAHFMLGNKVSTSLACSWGSSEGQNAVIEVTLRGTEGAYHMTNLDGSYYDFLTERRCGTSSEVLRGPNSDWAGARILAFAERLSIDNRFDRSAEQLVCVARIVDQIYGS